MVGKKKKKKLSKAQKADARETRSRARKLYKKASKATKAVKKAESKEKVNTAKAAKADTKRSKANQKAVVKRDKLETAYERKWRGKAGQEKQKKVRDKKYKKGSTPSMSEAYKKRARSMYFKKQ